MKNICSIWIWPNGIIKYIESSYTLNKITPIDKNTESDLLDYLLIQFHYENSPFTVWTCYVQAFSFVTAIRITKHASKYSWT